MIKICILSPGRCGSNFLFNCLLPRYFDNRENLVHTHDEKVAYDLEMQDYEIVTLRRRNMLDWVLSDRLMNHVPGKRKKEIEYYKSENVKSVFITEQEYELRRDQLIAHLSLYSTRWRVVYYEDLAKNPWKIVSSILGYSHWEVGSEKLNYDKSVIVKNYTDLTNLEKHLQEIKPYVLSV